MKICLLAEVVAAVIALLNLARRRWFAEPATKAASDDRQANQTNTDLQHPVSSSTSVCTPHRRARRGDCPNARGQAGSRVHEFHLAQWGAGHAGMDYGQPDVGCPGPPQG
jgi:hypothetical protein